MSVVAPAPRVPVALRRLWRSAWVMAAVVLGTLAGCAAPDRLAPGTPRDQVLGTHGQPTARYPAPDGGERLQYTMQPHGQRVYNVDLDRAGRVLRAEQALSEALFAQRIQPDRWTRTDVLHEYGPPSRTMGVRNFNGVIWIWRYADGPLPRLLYIDIDPGGMVRGYSSGDEPLPDLPDVP